MRKTNRFQDFTVKFIPVFFLCLMFACLAYAWKAQGAYLASRIGLYEHYIKRCAKNIRQIKSSNLHTSWYFQVTFLRTLDTPIELHRFYANRKESMRFSSRKCSRNHWRWHNSLDGFRTFDICLFVKIDADNRTIDLMINICSRTSVFAMHHILPLTFNIV